MSLIFPGYYTLHVLRDGKVTGMLSVNAANRRRLEPLVARSVRLHAGGASE